MEPILPPQPDSNRYRSWMTHRTTATWKYVILVIACVDCFRVAPARAADAPEPETLVPNPEQRRRIEAALPAVATATPKRPRHLLIFDGNVGYGGHPSIAYANLAFLRMGEHTGAFKTTITQDPAVFEARSLAQFDAVFFNNTVGNLFEDPVLRENLASFVFRGGGLMGVHGTTVAFTRWPGAHEDWPEFGRMIGGRGANHRESDEHVFIELDDPKHPINRVFQGKTFDYRDEFFRVHDPYSRSRLRVLLSFDTERTDMNQGPPRGDCTRPDNDYAVAWVKGYGRGRIFYCTIAHNPYVFWDPQMLAFYFSAAQFALGDLPGPTTPSARITPGIRARETLGWQLELNTLQPDTLNLFSLAGMAERSGVVAIGALATQRVTKDGPSLDEGPKGPVFRQALDDKGVRILTYRIDRQPKGRSQWLHALESARQAGAQIVIASPPARQLVPIANLCARLQLQFAIPATVPELGPDADNPSPESLVELARRVGPPVGYHIDLNATGSDSIALGLPPKRILSIQLPENLDTLNEQRLKRLLQHLAGNAPHALVVGIPAQVDDADAVRLFDQLCIEIASQMRTNRSTAGL